MTRAKPPLHWAGFTIRFVLCCLAMIVLLPVCVGQPPQRNSVDWIYVLDTSQSMIGRGLGAKDIFDNVKSSIKNFINRARPGDTVTIFRFDQNVEKAGGGTRSITTEDDKENLKSAIDKIQAQGSYTHTGVAIRDALKTSADLKKLPNAKDRAVMIVLFTDGQEDVSDMKSPFRLSDLSISQKESELPYSYLVWLKEGEPPQEIKDALEKLDGKIVPAPDDAAIDDLLNKIPVPAPKDEPPQPVNVALSMDPALIDFEQVEPGVQSEAKTIHCRSDHPIRVQLSISDAISGITLVEPKEAFDLEAGKTADVTVRISTAQEMVDRAYAFKLLLSPVNAGQNVTVRAVPIDAQVSVASVPGWRKALKWLLIALALLLVAVVLVSLRKGKTPIELWRDFIERKHLEGEIEVERPRPVQFDQGRIALPELKKEKVQLSTILPQGATKDSDAEIATVRKDHKKLVRITSTQGIVRVNRTEIAVADLYNNDIIELGDARIRFISLQERPDENLEESV